MTEKLDRPISVQQQPK